MPKYLVGLEDDDDVLDASEEFEAFDMNEAAQDYVEKYYLKLGRPSKVEVFLKLSGTNDPPARFIVHVEKCLFFRAEIPPIPHDFFN
jgi:hypothetical protein